MPDTSKLSETKRALLEKYLRGDLPQPAMAAGTLTRPAEARVGGPRECVVEVQSGGSKRPFFFLHGHWKNTPFFCFSLARELGPDQPFYALEPYLFDGLPVPSTIETIAAAHIKSMRAVQPEGPYLLGGWCNGGLIAYEVARQLHAVGQMVDLLVLVDPMYLGYRARRRVLRWVISRMGGLIGLGPDKQVDWFLRVLYVLKPLQYVSPLLYLHRRLRNALHGVDSVRLIIIAGINRAGQNAMTGIKRVIRMFKPGGGRGKERVGPPRPNSLVPTVEDLRQDYLGILEWLSAGYVPSSVYPGKITFFWPTSSPWHTTTVGWRQVAEAKEDQEVETHVIPGNQETWTDKDLPALAQRLRMCLSKVQKEVI